MESDKDNDLETSAHIHNAEEEDMDDTSDTSDEEMNESDFLLLQVNLISLFYLLSVENLNFLNSGRRMRVKKQRRNWENESKRIQTILRRENSL